MDAKLAAFMDVQLFTKKEVLQSFKLALNDIETANAENNFAEYIRRTSIYYQSFLERLKKAHLPDLTEPWWFYTYDLYADAIELHMGFASDLNWMMMVI